MRGMFFRKHTVKQDSRLIDGEESEEYTLGSRGGVTE